MSQENKYVIDSHGHIYNYNAKFHAGLIGTVLQFCLPPVISDAQLVSSTARTLQEVREQAAKVGLAIADGTPMATAQNQLQKFLASGTKTGAIKKTTGSKKKPAAVDLSNPLAGFDNAGKKTN
jgi:hypothetical protein